MLVIMDMEWVDWFSRANPTQISALRVTRNWQEADRFDRLICPDSEWVFSADHMAFTGYDLEKFRSATDAASALAILSAWLQPDDILCWWSAPTAAMFAAVWKDLFHADPPFSMCMINISIQNELHRFRLPLCGSAYTIATSAGIPLIENEHCSADDVNVILKLLRKLQPDQGTISHCLLPDGAVNKIMRDLYKRYESNGPERRYAVDLTHNRAHLISCSLIPVRSKIKEMATLEGVIRTLALPCTCCAEEYWRFSGERVDENIRKMQLNYIYSEQNGLFHKPSCWFVQHMPFPMIRGSVRYETAVAHGLQSCGVCNPHPMDEKEPVHSRQDGSVIARRNKAIAVASEDRESVIYDKPLNRHERNAVRRHEQAVREREAMPADLEGTDSHDAFILSASGFAFWAAEGYQTFHLHGCPKLNGLTKLRGFSRFSDACKYGLTPCKACKPTEKNDIIASVPLNQRVRKDETVQQIDAFCEKQGWKHDSRPDAYYIETTAAKWKLFIRSWPLVVHHMPKGSSDYHKQHRTFLSMTDTVEYIRRHDEKTAAEGEQGKNLEQMLRDARRDHEDRMKGRTRKAQH